MERSRYFLIFSLMLTLVALSVFRNLKSNCNLRIGSFRRFSGKSWALKRAKHVFFCFIAMLNLASESEAQGWKLNSWPGHVKALETLQSAHGSPISDKKLRTCAQKMRTQKVGNAIFAHAKNRKNNVTAIFAHTKNGKSNVQAIFAHANFFVRTCGR